MIEGLSGLELLLNINQANPANPKNQGPTYSENPTSYWFPVLPHNIEG